MFTILIIIGSFYTASFIRQISEKHISATSEEKAAAFHGGAHPDTVDGYDDHYDNVVLHEQASSYLDHSIF